ncbi:hypothetical protein R1flu_006564 [Riccia fluitans]|uniref:Uncharacterized protein n=1 Tax=Riccia fluitans TaxID=41844 RepID=A0ABD1YWP9_9MARC
MVDRNNGSKKAGHERGEVGLARLRHEFLRFREEIGCIRSLTRVHPRWPSRLARLETESDSEAFSEDGSSWDTEELPHGTLLLATADGETADCVYKGISVHKAPQFPDLCLKSSCATREVVQECLNVQCDPVLSDGSAARSVSDEQSKNLLVLNQSECDVFDVGGPNASRLVSARCLGGLDAGSFIGLNKVERESEEFESIKTASFREISSETQDLSDPSISTDEVPRLRLGNQEEERNCTFDASHSPTNNIKTADLTNSIEAAESIDFWKSDERNHEANGSNTEEKITRPYYVGQIKTLEDQVKIPNDRNLTELRRVEDTSDDEALDSTRSHSGSRIAATAYFTANPCHKYDDDTLLVPHRHSRCENEGVTQVDVNGPNILTSASCREGESCIHQEEKEDSDDGKDSEAPGMHGKLSNSQLIQMAFPEGCKRKLKLVSYVYEEVPPTTAAQASDQLTPPDLGDEVVQASMIIMPASFGAEKQVDLTPGPSQSNTIPITAAMSAEGRNVERQGAGNSSLIALTGLDSLTTLGEECRQDHGLAARMETRIRNALETLGEPCGGNETSNKGSATSVTGLRYPLGMGELSRSRGTSGIGSSRAEKKLRFKTAQPEHKSIGGDKHHYTEGWLSADSSPPAARSRGSARPVEPETYLRHVIAALDSANVFDVQEESDSRQELSSSPEDARKKPDSRLEEHNRSYTHIEEGMADLCSLDSNRVAHQHHCKHWRRSSLQGTGSSSCPFHMDRRPCCSSEMQPEPLVEQRHLNSCFTAGCRRISSEGKSSPHMPEEGFPRVVRNSGNNNLSFGGTDCANPQAFCVKINGSMVEIEVGEEPPSILWNPRGHNDQTVAIRTSTYRSEEQNRTGTAHDELYGPSVSMSGQPNSPRILPNVSDLGKTNMLQTSDDSRVVRFRDPNFPGGSSKSVRFDAGAKEPEKKTLFSPKQIRESFDRSVKCLARRAQRQGEAVPAGEAASESEHSPRRTQEKANEVRIRSQVKSKRGLATLSPECLVGLDSVENNVAEARSSKNRHGVTVPVAPNIQEELPACSILKSSRGASDSDSDVQDHSRGTGLSKMTDGIRYSAVPRAAGMKAQNGTSDTEEKEELLEAAASGLAHELELLKRSRSPRYLKVQEELHNHGSSASEVSGYRQGLRPQRTKKLPGHFRPRKEAIVSHGVPCNSQSVYHSMNTPHSGTRSRTVGQLRSTTHAGSSFLQSGSQKLPVSRLRSVTKSHQLHSLTENGTTVLGDEGGRNRSVYEEAQHLTQTYGSASWRRAKQTVKEAIGEVFDYDQFQQKRRMELGELASERKRVEWLGRSLALRSLDGVHLKQMQTNKLQHPGLERSSRPAPANGTKDIGSSGNKRHRSAISPLRDPGKKARSLETKVDEQLFPHTSIPLDGSLGSITQLDVLHVGRSNFSPCNVGSKTQKSEGVARAKDNSLSTRPSQKLAPEFKTSAKDAISCMGFEVSSVVRNDHNLKSTGVVRSHRPAGEKLAIKRKSLQPPGSIFKVATPVSWFPSDSSVKGRKMDLLSGIPTFEARGIKETARNKCTSKPKNADIILGKGTRKANTMVPKGVSQKPQGERGSLNSAKLPVRYIHETAEFPSDLCKWLLTPDADLNDQHDSVLKPELVSVETEGAELKTSCSKERNLERQSWSERMKTFLLSCGALLPETDPSKQRKNSKQPSFTSKLDARKDVDYGGTDSQEINDDKKEVLLPLRWPKVHNCEEKLVGKTGRLNDTKNKVRLISSDVKKPLGVQKSRRSPRKSNKHMNIHTLCGGERSPGKKTRLVRSFDGETKDVSMPLKAEVRGKSPTTKCLREGGGKGPRNMRLMEVKDKFQMLLSENKGENAQKTSSPAEFPDVKDEPDNQNRTLKFSTPVEGSLEERDSELGIRSGKSLRGSVENWLSTSGGFEFLDILDGHKQNLEEAKLSETIQKKTDFRSPSDRTSLHSWSARSAEIGTPQEFTSIAAVNFQEKTGKAVQDDIAYLPRIGLQSCSDPRRNVDTPEKFPSKSEVIEKDTEPDGNSSSFVIRLQTQEITDSHADPVDSFMRVFQEYKEKFEVRGLTSRGVAEAGKSLVADTQLTEKKNNFDLKPLNSTAYSNQGTRSSSDTEEKLTESEELELALLELVIKTVLRGDLMKNSKSGLVTYKQGTSSFPSNPRETQTIRVDQAVQASVRDGRQLSPTTQAGDSAKSSAKDWPNHTHLMEKQSPCGSCDEDEDWPEYLGLDDENGDLEGVEMGSPLTKENPVKTTELETVHGPPASGQPLQEAERTSPPSPRPTIGSERHTMELAQFPGLSSIVLSTFERVVSGLAERSLTGVPNATPETKEDTSSSISDRKSPSVQPTDLSALQPSSSLHFLPVYCLTDGRPFLSPFLTPYSIYPQYPVTVGPSHIQDLQFPPLVQNIQPTGATAATTAEDVRGIRDNVRTSLQSPKQKNKSNGLFERKVSSSTSSDSPFSSPDTPSTPVSSPDHEARVASALAHPRRQKGHLIVAADDVDDKSNQENEEIQIQQEPDGAQFTVSGEKPTTPARQPDAEKGLEDSPLQLPVTNILENGEGSPTRENTNLAFLGGSATLVANSVYAASPNTRKEPEFNYYGSSELADSYDGSGSSDISSYPGSYTGLPAPLVGLSRRELGRLNQAPTTTVDDAAFSATESRAYEARNSLPKPLRHAHGLQVNVGRYSVEGYPKDAREYSTMWSVVPKELGLRLSEGEIDPGALRSEGECGWMYNRSDVSPITLRPPVPLVQQAYGLLKRSEGAVPEFKFVTKIRLWKSS